MKSKYLLTNMDIRDLMCVQYKSKYPIRQNTSEGKKFQNNPKILEIQICEEKQVNWRSHQGGW